MKNKVLIIIGSVLFAAVLIFAAVFYNQNKGLLSNQFGSGNFAGNASVTESPALSMTPAASDFPKISASPASANENSENNAKSTAYPVQKKPPKNTKGMPLVPDFTLNSLEGSPLSLSAFEGKIIVLNFFATWCPPCQAEMPDFNRLNKDFEQMGDVVLLGINQTDGQRETREKVEKFFESNNYSFKVLLDEKFEITSMFGASSIPMTFVIDREGYLATGFSGQTTREQVLAAVNKLR